MWKERREELNTVGISMNRKRAREKKERNWVSRGKEEETGDAREATRQGRATHSPSLSHTQTLARTHTHTDKRMHHKVIYAIHLLTRVHTSLSPLPLFLLPLSLTTALSTYTRYSHSHAHTHSVSPFFPELAEGDSSAAATEFLKAFSGLYGDPPTALAALAYTSIYMWRDAVEQVYSFQAESVRDSLRGATIESPVGTATVLGHGFTSMNMRTVKLVYKANNSSSNSSDDSEDGNSDDDNSSDNSTDNGSASDSNTDSAVTIVMELVDETSSAVQPEPFPVAIAGARVKCSGEGERKRRGRERERE